MAFSAKLAKIVAESTTARFTCDVCEEEYEYTSDPYQRIHSSRRFFLGSDAIELCATCSNKYIDCVACAGSFRTHVTKCLVNV